MLEREMKSKNNKMENFVSSIWTLVSSYFVQIYFLVANKIILLLFSNFYT